jgi:hypothetical protein
VLWHIPCETLGEENSTNQMGGGHMNALAHKSRLDSRHSDELSAFTSSLYDLIEAISDEVEPGEDQLVCATVLSLMKSGKIKRAYN